ncbi:MAG: hypothetical protein HQM15_11480 [Deltaproteobacteria bacterium]|nr:hypothetical protein [Deltaproteobacteria bacterium]
MTTTLQEALLKAGLAKSKSLPDQKDKKKTILKSGEQRPAQARFDNREDKAPIRTFCEACKRSGPDIELYEHQNRLISAKWICVRCADTHNIHDNTRQTHQSQHAKNGMFRREYGPTKVFSKRL